MYTGQDEYGGIPVWWTRPPYTFIPSSYLYMSQIIDESSLARDGGIEQRVWSGVSQEGTGYNQGRYQEKEN